MKTLFYFTTLFFLLAVQTTHAQMSKTIEGVAIDSKGVPLPDGTKEITFNIYDSIDSDVLLWSEQQNVAIKDGRFSATLGSANSLELPENKTYWLGMKVGQGNELSPRLELKLAENDDTTTQKSALQGNTLDMAYDEGGAGAGRTITADAGAVNIAGPDGLTVNGVVGIGTTSPTAHFHVNPGTITQEIYKVGGTTSANKGVNMALTNTNTTTGARGFELSPTMQGQNGAAGIGINPQIHPQANSGTMYGVLNLATITNGAFDITNFHANRYQVRTNATYTGTITNANGLQMGSPGFNGSTATNVTGLRIQNQGVSGVTNAYGLFIEPQSGATNNYAAIFQGGNVGIGTITPQSKLHLFNNGAIDLKISAAASPFEPSITFATTLDLWKIYRPGNQPDLRFRNLFDVGGGIDDRFTLTSLGNVGIGTTSPDNTLTVGPPTGSTGYRISVNGSVNGILAGGTTIGGYFRAYNSFSGDKAVWAEQLNSAGYAVYATGGKNYFSGNVGIGTTSPSFPLEMGSGAHVTVGGVWTNASSREYKENIRELTVEEAMTALRELQPTRFNYKVDKEEEHVGFIAEDVPELLANNDRNGLSPMDIVAVLTKVVQEQQKKIEALEARLNAGQ